MRAWPLSGSERPPITPIVVVLPAPLGPRKPVTVPGSQRNVTSETTVRPPSRLVSPLVWIRPAGSWPAGFAATVRGLRSPSPSAVADNDFGRGSRPWPSLSLRSSSDGTPGDSTLYRWPVRLVALRAARRRDRRPRRGAWPPRPRRRRDDLLGPVRDQRREPRDGHLAVAAALASGRLRRGRDRDARLFALAAHPSSRRRDRRRGGLARDPPGLRREPRRHLQRRDPGSWP